MTPRQFVSCSLVTLIAACGGGDDDASAEFPGLSMSAYRLSMPSTTDMQTDCTPVRVGFWIESAVSNAVPAALAATALTVSDATRVYQGSNLASSRYRQFGGVDLSNWKDVLTGAADLCLPSITASGAIEVRVQLKDGSSTGYKVAIAPAP